MVVRYEGGMWLVVLRVPPEPWPIAQIAHAAGLAPADVRQRMAGGAPCVLRAGSAPEIEAAAAALDELGLAALACSPESAPTDDDRVVARALELRADGFVATDAQGNVHPCPAGAVRLIQKGARTSVDSDTVTTTERKLSATRALLTGGLMLTKTVSRQDSRTTTSREGFLLVQRDDGEPDVMIYDRRIDWRFLGAQMAQGSAANLAVLLDRLRALAPSAAFDDRAARPGLVQRMPKTGAVDAVDLALHLVGLAHLRLARWNRP